MRLDESDNWMGKLRTGKSRQIKLFVRVNVSMRGKELLKHVFEIKTHSKHKEKRFLDYRKSITGDIKPFYTSYIMWVVKGAIYRV